jgi:SDR family mycofactocin-dependent oxidoreductase
VAGGLENKVAVVTGAARGVGRSVAVRFAEEGADVICLDICSEVGSIEYPMAMSADLEETAELVGRTGRHAAIYRADVRDFDQLDTSIKAGLAQFGRIDVVCANAGVCGYVRNTWDMTVAQWTETIDTNLTGVWNTVRATIPTIIDQGAGGSIVIMSSTAGLRGMAGLGHYCAAKHGLVGLARTLAIELAPHQVRVNTVHPTGVDTPMVNNESRRRLSEARRLEGDRSESRGNLLDVRQLDARDVSNAVVWLCSDYARYLTGVALPVDAGFVQK